MAWVRIDDQVPRHSKMLKAGPAACWLWVCGIAHCQSQLTDGFISDDVLPMIGVAGAPRCRRLADGLVKVGLFGRVSGGYEVHDYLDSNQSRACVLQKRAEDVERKRVGDERRTSDSNGRRGAESIAPPRTDSGRIPSGFQTDSSSPRAGVPSHPIPSESKEEEREKPSLSPPADAFTDPEITKRAGAFIRSYEALYPKHRKGARYAVKPVRDYAAAVTLCQTWPDDRLEKLAVIFLTTDHKFAEEGSRTVPQFLAIASWCDSKLAEHEAKRRPA